MVEYDKIVYIPKNKPQFLHRLDQLNEMKIVFNKFDFNFKILPYLFLQDKTKFQ